MADGDGYGFENGASRDRKPKLIEQAKQGIKDGPNKPNWRFEVDGEETKLVSATVNFTADGSSGMKFVCRDNLAGFENTFCKLWIGYGGELVPYFKGRLREPDRHSSGLYCEGTAEGISARLGTRYVGRRLSYNGKRLRWAAKDLMERAGIPDGWWNIRGGTEEIDVEDDNDVQFENSYLETLRMLCDPLGYVAIDQPGFQEIFTVREKPGPLYWDGLEGQLNEGQYPKGGFSYKRGLKGFYSEVIVFRRDTESDEGADTHEKFAVFARRRVPNNSARDALGNRFYMIPDFIGNQREAEKEAARMAKVLMAAPGEFSLTCSPIDFHLYNTIGVERKELRYRYEYACVITEIEMRLAPKVFEMTVSGEAITRFGKGGWKPGFGPEADAPRSTSIVVTSSGETPSTQFEGWGQEDTTFEDLTDDYSELY